MTEIQVAQYANAIDDKLAEKIDNNLVPDYLIKPFEMIDLKKKIREVLAKQKHCMKLESRSFMSEWIVTRLKVRNNLINHLKIEFNG